MESLGERLTYVLEIRHLNPNKLSIMANIHASTIKNYLINKGNPDNDKLDKISKALDISSEWLKNGVGDMGVGDSIKKENPQQNDESLKDRMIAYLMKDNEELRQRLKDRNNN